MSFGKSFRNIAAALALLITVYGFSFHGSKAMAEDVSEHNLTASLPDGSIYSSPSDSNDPPSKAFDGFKETWWTGLTKDESKGYWIVCDLGGFYNISRWVVNNFTSVPNLSVRGYELQISVDNKSYQKADSIYEVLNAETTDRTLDKPVLARYVKLYIPADLTGTDGIARIAEFQVFGAAAAEADHPYTNDYTAQPNNEDSANILAGRTTGISYSAGDPNDPPKKSFDGDNATWSTFWGNGQDANPWLQADLGGSYTLTKWGVKNSDIFDGYFICSNYNLLVSEDGTNWTKVDTIDNSSYEVVTEQQLSKPVEAKYVRLEMTRGANGKISKGDDLARIAEFELFAQNTNILAAKTAGISYSSGDPNDPPKKSFDGDTATWSTFWPDPNEGEHAHPWLQADLGMTYLIKNWKVVNSNVFDGTFICSNYSLQISDDGISWSTVDSIDNSTYELSTEKTLAKPVQTHFVRLVVTPGGNGKISRGDNLARIAEFEVYGSAVVEQPDSTPTPDDEPQPEPIQADLLTGMSTGVAYSGGTGLSNAFDGDEKTWANVTSASEQLAWISAQLGGTYILDKWEVIGYPDDPQFVSTSFSLQTSDDGTDWTTVDAIDNSSKQVEVSKALMNSVLAKHVRLLINRGTNGKLSDGDDFARIAAFKVYGIKTNNVLSDKVDGLAFSGGADLAKMTDNDPSGTWASVTATVYSPAWASADLGETHGISAWGIRNYPNDEKFIALNYSLQVSDDNNNWTTVDTIDNSTKQRLTQKVLNTEVQAKYVRVLFHWQDDGKLCEGDAYARIADFQVFGGPVSQLLEGRTNGILSSGGDPNDPPSKAFDGDADNTWTTIAAGPDGVWLQADLYSLRTVSSWSVKNFPQIESLICYNYSLQISNDGMNWTTVDTIDNTSQEIDTTSSLTAPVHTRYVRLLMNKGAGGKISSDGYARIAELEIYGW